VAAVMGWAEKAVSYQKSNCQWLESAIHSVKMSSHPEEKTNRTVFTLRKQVSTVALVACLYSIGVDSVSAAIYELMAVPGDEVILASDGSRFIASEFDAGTGDIDPFLTIKAHGSGTIERGHNLDTSLDGVTIQNDERATGGGGRTHALLLSEVPFVTLDGQAYLDIGFDINESDDSQVTKQLDLTSLQIFTNSDAGLMFDFDMYGSGPAEAFGAMVGDATPYGVLRYNFDGTEDNTLTINPLNDGSGTGDVRILIRFETFMHANLTDNVFVWAELDRVSAGFEEFTVRHVENPEFPPLGEGAPGTGGVIIISIPEPSAALLFVLGAMVTLGRRSRGCERRRL
jgi:hypothetical protein